MHSVKSREDEYMFDEEKLDDTVDGCISSSKSYETVPKSYGQFTVRDDEDNSLITIHSESDGSTLDFFEVLRRVKNDYDFSSIVLSQSDV